MEEIILIRHGESEANVGLTDEPDCSLTPKGIEQARSVGRRLSPLDLSHFKLWVSPYNRARCTADLISETIGRPFEIEPRIREWGARCSIDSAWYEIETREQLAARIADVYASMRGERHVIVSHAAPIAAMLRAVAQGGIPKLGDDCFWEGVENCCFYHLRDGQLTMR